MFDLFLENKLMGKTDKALMRFKKEGGNDFFNDESEKTITVYRKQTEGFLSYSHLEWCNELRAKIVTARRDGEIKTLMFTGASSGCGSTTIAAGFALNLAKVFQKKILLVDANLRKPMLQSFFDKYDGHVISQLFPNGTKMERKLEGKKGVLNVITCNENHAAAVDIFSSNEFHDFIMMMKSKFDYVIFDTAPISKFSESRILACLLDGILLIVESTKDRKQVILKAKKQIDSCNSNLIGVILNRRKYYIPSWLYKYL
jgi:capsular exopolysaccharide synthesis family protein